MGSALCQGCLVERLQNERLRTRLRETEREVQELQSHHALRLKGLIRHCEDGSCETHGSEWKQIKQNVIARALEKLPDEFIEQQAMVRGILPGSTRIRIKDTEKTADAQKHGRLVTTG